MDYDQCHVLSPFSHQGGLTFHLSQPRIKAHCIPNLGLEDVINILLDNRILPSWMDHSYLYGLIYLNAHYTRNGPHQALFDKIDNERLAHLQLHSIPPPIVEWDRWRSPSEGDIARLHAIVDAVEDKPPAPAIVVMSPNIARDWKPRRGYLWGRTDSSLTLRTNLQR